MFLVVFISNGLSQSVCNPDLKECSCADAYFAVFLHISYFAFDNRSSQHFKIGPKSGTFNPPLAVLDLFTAFQDCGDFSPSVQDHVDAGIEECMALCQVRSSLQSGIIILATRESFWPFNQTKRMERRPISAYNFRPFEVRLGPQSYGIMQSFSYSTLTLLVHVTGSFITTAQQSGLTVRCRTTCVLSQYFCNTIGKKDLYTVFSAVR